MKSLLNIPRVEHALLFLCLLFSPITTSAQSGQDLVALNLQDAEIAHLIEWASGYMDETIVVHPSVNGKVTVIAGNAFPTSKVEAVFRSVLQIYGYLAVRSDDNTLRIIPEAMLPSDAVERNSDGKDTIVQSHEVITRIIPINEHRASDIADKLKPFLSKSAVISVLPGTNMLIVADRTAQIIKISELIAQIDVPVEYSLNYMALRNGKADEIIARIKELLPSEGQGAINNLKLTADTRTNAILYSGNESQIRLIEGLASRLDQPSHDNTNTRVIPLNYADAASVAPILKNIAESVSNRIHVSGTRETQTIIEVSEKQNALVLTSDEVVIAELMDVISQLDRRRQQVLVEALIVEVNEEDAQDIGVEWKALLGSEGAYAGMEALTKNLPTPELPGIGPGLTLGFLDIDETSFLIRALEISGAANILSKPTIVALDNEEAEILVGENVPFITGSSTSSASPTNNPFQTITRQDIGITLAIRPQINQNGSITLEIDQKVESLSDSVTSTADVVTNKRQIQTHVLIEHDQILVLGGLIRDELREAEKQVPLLGDLPLIGRLFSGTSAQVLKKNLMVFIHPRILDSEQDQIAVTRRSYQHIAENQEYINRKIDRFFITQSPPHIQNDDYWKAPEIEVEEAEETDEEQDSEGSGEE